MAIVATVYRPRRPPRKRKAVAIAGPAIVRKVKAAKGVHTADTPKSGQAPPPPANDDRKPAIVTARRQGARRVDVPDLAPEEYQRRGDAADALWRELVRRATSKDRP